MSGLKGLNKKDNPDYEARTGVNGQTYYKKKDDVTHNQENREALRKFMEVEKDNDDNDNDNVLLENIKDDLLDGLENTGEKTMRFSRPNSIGMRNAIIEDVFTISDGNGDVAFQKQSELMTMSEKDYHHTVDQFAEVALNISENNAKRKEKISQDRQHIQELKKDNPTLKRGYNFIEGVEDDFFVEIPVERSWGGAYYPFLSKKEGIENQIILQRYIDNMQEPASSMGILLNCQDLYKNAYRDKRIYNDPNTTIYWDSHGVVITRGNDNPKPSYVFRKGLDFYESHKDIDYDVSFNCY